MIGERRITDLYDTLLSNYISYDRLYQMSKYVVLYDERQDASKVALFFDLNSYFKRVWLPYGYGYLNENVLAASVINACAHYRSFFASRHNIATDIYLVWGYDLPSNAPVEYNAHFRERIMTNQLGNELIQKNLEMLRIMCPYLPNVYLIEGGENEVSGIIYTLAQNITCPKVILTKDAYDYQLVAYCPSTFIFRPMKKVIDGRYVDQSWVVSKKNLFKSMRLELDYVQGGPYPSDVTHLGHVLALAGLKARHIKGDMTFNRACSVISTMEEEDEDTLKTPDTMAYTLHYGTIPQLQGVTIKNPDAVITRGILLDATLRSVEFINSPEFVKLETEIVDMYDPQGIMEIASKEFDEYPLDTGSL